MVHEHLQVVFALLFDVDDEDLLEVESPLDEVVELEQAIDFPVGPALPDAVDIEPEVRVVGDVLRLSASRNSPANICGLIPCPATMKWCSIQSTTPAP